MTDFVSRVAARAVGRAPLAQPSVPATFAPAPAPEPDTAVAVAEPRHAFGPAPGAASNNALLGNENARGTNAEAVLAAPPPLRTDSPQPAPETPPPPATPSARADPLDMARDTSSPGISVAEVNAADAVPAGRPPARAPSSTQVVVARPAEPAAVVVGASAGDEPAAQAAAPPESPAVRVHIGRLEVRANLHEAPPRPQRRRTESAPAGPSLSEYLRGRRTAS